MSEKIGVLLVNLGTPNSPTKSEIRKYLKEFLMDKNVIQLSWLARAILVYGFILPFRPKKLISLYQAIWTKKGSPLLTISQELKEKLQEHLGESYQVELGMRYGYPNISASLEILHQSCRKLIIFPQFPQYAESTTRSIHQVVFEFFKEKVEIPELIMIRDFYNLSAFIQCQKKIIKQVIVEQKIKPDYYLFSFHGLPESHVKKTDKIPCDLSKPCLKINKSNQYCYRAQCYETARSLARALNLSESEYEVSFQSRLGRTPWIKPYTDEILPKLIKKGIKNLVVSCPAFTVDCLETLEEITISAKKEWKNLGGQSFVVAPCVNSHQDWVKGLSEMIILK